MGVTEGSGWVEFDALVEVLAWGRNVYTVIRVEQALETAAKTAGTRRVEGTIDDVPVNVGLNRADVLPDAFMYAGKGLQRRLRAEPGDLVTCRLRPADPDEVPLADDVHRALADAGRLEAFHRRKAADRRRLLHPIEEAVRPDTRRQRIAALLRSLSTD
jgi:hypothetical protein